MELNILSLKRAARADRPPRRPDPTATPAPPPCGGSSPISASPPTREQATADRRPGTTRRSISYRTGRPWRNRHPSMSSIRKCSGSPLPLPACPGDAPLPAPKPRPTAPHARSANPRRRPHPVRPRRPRQLPRGACYAPPGDATLRPDPAARAVGLPIPIPYSCVRGYRPGASVPRAASALVISRKGLP
jgi:hypothetical protein